MKPTPELEHPDWCAELAGRLQGPSRVLLPEGGDPRVQAAAAQLSALGLKPVLVVDPVEPGFSIRRHDGVVESVEVTDLAVGRAGDRVTRAGEQRGWESDLSDRRRRDPLYLAAALLDLGAVDAVVAGCRHPSGEVMRAALHLVGLHPDSSLLSGSFLLRERSGRAMAFADCAVVPEPDTEQLADIAISTAGTFAALTGEQPRIAMLSFSTLGSAAHGAAQAVRAATDVVRRRRPDLPVGGELQFDAAYSPEVAAQKAPDSPVAGSANVFVFPNLAAGNIGYKIAQRLGGLDAFGPILQGLRLPMNDLSRGCTAGDIVSVAVISAVQAETARRDGIDPQRTPGVG